MAVTKTLFKSPQIIFLQIREVVSGMGQADRRGPPRMGMVKLGKGKCRIKILPESP
ncbi:hypothetical protein LguiA_011786 [Lonicera macranthoides]